MRVLITGAGGRVGRFILADLIAAGHEVVTLGRAPVDGAEHLPWELGAPVTLPAAAALVHAAFDHLPGLYRGGEGEDPEGFWRRNVEGSRQLFEAALARGVARLVFLSSRAAYGDPAPGERLLETDPPAAGSTLYGQAKHATERMLDALADQGARPVSLRATGVFGQPPGGPEHKWADLFRAWLGGERVAPRVATEVHGADLAAAVRLMLETPETERLYNVSDIVLDRRDLLARVAALTGAAHPPPERADASALAVMATDRLRALGWRPAGLARLEADLPDLVARAQAPLSVSESTQSR
ncbi:NAD-dependent epimerase/dehydratase family protein [Amaricoccus solimangrovi]|uniref:NAD(P)-dependent oxidoreductase n=1 Tax=Amaricoccus solimangrovi TaxID=2589815 RepID=A0A501WX61_9RHOB|nr:NAD(P)-dependent oxidoreductase [Amaricoccus solimangrovi]TPE52027.1 NAD(P)-dependent oxidoreductase [Amaricoccus solimangrovi]